MEVSGLVRSRAGAPLLVRGDPDRTPALARSGCGRCRRGGRDPNFAQRRQRLWVCQQQQAAQGPKGLVQRAAFGVLAVVLRDVHKLGIVSLPIVGVQLLGHAGRDVAEQALLTETAEKSGGRYFRARDAAALDRITDSDAVFGVRDSLIVDYAKHAAGTKAPDGKLMDKTFYTAQYDFKLVPAA